MGLTQEERDALVLAWLDEVEASERDREPEVEEEDDWNYVLGMDPGGTTGVALLRYKPDVLPELVYLHQIPGGREGFYDYFVGSSIGENLVIASELWVEKQKKGVNREPMYIEGVQYAFWHGEGIVYQEPSQKSLIPDEYLKEQNLWTPGKRHQMDALIHALVYLRNNDHKPTMESLAGENDDKMAEEGEAAGKTLSDEQGEGEQGDGQAEGDATQEGDGEGAGEGEGELGEAGGPPSGKPSKQGTPTFAELLEQLAKADKAGTKGGNREQAATEEALVDPGDNGYIKPDVEVKGPRKRRERNGVFSGYDTETDGVEKELYSD